MYAMRIGQHLTLWFCDHIKHAIIPAPTNQSFQGPDPNTLHVLPGQIEITGLPVTVIVTRRYPGDEIAKALKDFSLKEAAPTPAFANDIIVARQMYIAALTIENAASRFLIIYSALAAFAAFKLGTKGRTQSRVEKILTDEDPTIPMIAPPPQATITIKETEFTSARNDFIHAEDRGRQPTAAAAVIEGMTPKFQALVGRILRKG
jgi:hypothetical protein